MHDDLGNIVRTYDDDYGDNVPDGMEIRKDAISQEWYELKPPPVVKVREPPEAHIC